MSVVALVENWEGSFKKTSFELVTYSKKIADKLGEKLTIITFGGNNIEHLTKYGADKILNISTANFEKMSNIAIAKTYEELIKDEFKYIIISNTNTGKSVAPLLAYNLNAGLISNAISEPENYDPLIVNCKAFSSKAYAKYESNYKKNIISILPNSIGEVLEKQGEGNIADIDLKSEITNDNRLKINTRNKLSGKISLSDAEIVISGGRGLKSGDNWEMIEELAELLGAGTACSKPVSDMGWRPHSEHVGQTGLAINPELYIAIGISGAIQHLAGVSSSKNIVVINTDPEAPFFKAANYGIIGDAFDVVPKLIDAIKEYKN